MSFSKRPILASSAAVLAALSLVPQAGSARDRRPIDGEVVREIAPMSREASRDVIFEMAPMKPVKKSATAPAAAKSAPLPTAEQPAPPAAIQAPAQEVATGAPAVDKSAITESQPSEEPKPAEAQATAEPPKPGEMQRAAEAPNPLNTQAELENPAVATPAGGQQEAPEAQVAAETPVVEAPPQAGEAAVASEAPSTAPFSPPMMTQNPLHLTLAASTQAQALKRGKKGRPTENSVVITRAAQAPAQTVDAQAPAAEAVVAAPPRAPSRHDAETPAAAKEAPAEPVAADQAPPPAVPTEAPAPVVANENPAPTDSQAPAPVDPALEQAMGEAHIAALLAEGIKGPAEVRISDRATMWLPAGRIFIPTEPARQLAKEAGLELRPGVQGLVAPSPDGLQWLAPVELFDDGYIEISDTDALQPEKLLAAFAAGLPEANAQRARTGQPPVTLEGWLSPPTLDDKRRLSACVSVTTQGDPNGADRFFNCEAWVLGRDGAVRVSLADGAEEAERLKGEALALAGTIVYDHGRAYEDADLAADKVAPYAAADLLTRDVSARASAPATPATGSAPKAPVLLLLIAKLWKLILVLAAATAGVFAWMKRRKAKAQGAPSSSKPSAPVVSPAKQVAPDKGPSSAPAPQESLFARLLPTLHARLDALRKKTRSGAAVAAKDAGVAPAPAVERDTEAPKAKSARSGLLGRLAGLRMTRKDGSKSPPAAVSVVNASEADKASVAANDAEEPISALKKLAMKMRRSNKEAPAPPVDVSRAIRAARRPSGAAPALAEAIEPETEFDAASVATTASEAKLEADVIGLIEPGDEAATSVAISAGRALREARG